MVAELADIDSIYNQDAFGRRPSMTEVRQICDVVNMHQAKLMSAQNEGAVEVEPLVNPTAPLTA